MMTKKTFGMGFLVVMLVMNVYWNYYPPSAKYLSRDVLDSKYAESSLYKRVLVINSLVLICLIIEFVYLCDHTLRGQEYMIYICVIAIVSANRSLVFVLHPISVHYLRRLSFFSYLLVSVPVFLLVVIYLSSKQKKLVVNRH